jgi:hypothetical protein
MKYNFDLQDSLSAIYHYGESIATNNDNKAYWTEQLNKAVSQLGTNWRVSFESYKGASKKYKGWATVTVIADSGQDYGFKMPSALAQQVNDVITEVWKKVIHGDFTA